MVTGVLEWNVFLPGRIKIGTGDPVGSGVKCTFSRLANDARLCGAVDTLEGKDSIQRDLVRLGRVADAAPRRFNKAEGKVLHRHQDKLKQKYRLGRELIESSLEEKGLGSHPISVILWLSNSQACVWLCDKGYFVFPEFILPYTGIVWSGYL